ncbi:MAG: hypothetical protein HY074_10695 [Deltaproteobacteria bacterium]|nr:hypothetical protein [Deltaproteobacteria bacterium]
MLAVGRAGRVALRDQAVSPEPIRILVDGMMTSAVVRAILVVAVGTPVAQAMRAGAAMAAAAVTAVGTAVAAAVAVTAVGTAVAAAVAVTAVGTAAENMPGAVMEKMILGDCLRPERSKQTPKALVARTPHLSLQNCTDYWLDL